jgi:hypothetical protein
MYEKFQHPSVAEVAERIKAEAEYLLKAGNDRRIADGRKPVEGEAAASVLASLEAKLAQDPSNLTFPGLYAFVEAPAQMLGVIVPPGAKWGTRDDGKQKTIGEFCFIHAYSLDKSKVVVMLAAIEAPTYRNIGVTVQDLADWELFLTAYGFTPDTWMNIEELNTLLQTKEYASGEA